MKPLALRERRLVGRRVFPRIRAGASLKRLGLGLAALPAVGFPPHSCGGLIEARLAAAHHHRSCSFSPAFVRGPH